MRPADVLKSDLKERAHQLGFERCGIAPATPADGFDRLQEWLSRGYAGEMAYLETHAEARRDPISILQDVKSVVMVGMVYSDSTAHSPIPSTAGRVARYAQGPDYHQVLWRKLDELLAWFKERLPDCHGRSVVDTAPLLERDFARRAGLGWIGKNTMLIDKRLGSYLFLGALLVNVELQPDSPHEASHCGTCTACLDACPTEAFAGPGWLDARRCISYLTIELRTPMPDNLRNGVGDWLFGCDVCQEVCPWNHKARQSPFPHRDDLETLDPIEILGMDEVAFRERFRGTAIMRTKRRGLLRNAAIVLANTGNPSALPALQIAVNDPDPLIQEAARWAIEQILRGSESAPFSIGKSGANP